MENAAWAAFSAPSDFGEFCNSWLAILCVQIERVKGGLLLLGSEKDGAYSVAAVWPDAGRNMQYLGPAAEMALKERRGVVVGPDGAPRRADDKATYVAYPVEVSGQLHGTVVLDIHPASEAELRKVLRLIHWGIAWLIDRFRQQMLAEQEARTERLALVSDLIATAIQEKECTAAALAVANELAMGLKCDRVSLGFEHEGSIEIEAISNTSTFDRKSNLVRLIGEAMDEALDLEVSILYPPPPDDELGALAHAELARELDRGSICSVPLLDGGHAIGALCLERAGARPFTAEEVEVCTTAGLMLGPFLALKHEQSRPLWQRGREAVMNGARALFGPRHPGLKLVAASLAVVVLFFSFYETDYRVAATTVIEGAVQRAAVAPFDGYVAESLVRAGDVVRKGQILCRLDDKDLRLEQAKWASERAQLLAKHHQALAALDRPAMAVLAAQLAQAEAQLSLVEEKLARATLIAPFDGVVVSGDLSQLLGTPIEQGKVLFEMAPLDAYRVILKVDERDISEIRLGQTGDLALSGIPNELMPFAVTQITPVTTSQDGRNYFRVEARIDQASLRLRPGMEGVGKVLTGPRKLIWIWTHSLVDWLRLWVWNWMP